MKQRQFASLTTRIGLLFAAIAMVTFNAVGAYLCRSLETELQARDDVDLHEKITHIRHLLEETPSGEFIDQNPSRFIDAAAGHEGMLLVLKNKEGAILMQNTAEASRLPQLRIAAVDMALDNAAIQSWTLPSGTPARVASAWGRVGKGTDEKVQIIVAQSTAARMALLASHERTVTIAVMIGALLAGLLGYLITRAGLNPIRRLAHQAHTITAQRLDTRLDAATAPRELQTLIEAFNAMLDRLHESFQQLSQFSADLAHDIRTPINNLMVQTQVALSQPRPVDEYQTLLVSNIEEYERLARMIESMLFLARADHAHVAPSSQSVDIHTELQRVAEYFEGVAEEANVALTVEAAGTLRADTALFRRAVNNLVVNAIRHASPGTQITLAAERLDEMVAVKVSNRGAAIDPVHLPRLFDRFYRADQSRTDSSSSTGLGLSIVHSIMKMHGGRVDVSSESDITTFRLLFPH